MIPMYLPNILINLRCGTLSIQNCDHDHNQNYVNVNHARSQNNVALSDKKFGVLIIQIMYTTSQNHSHSQNHARSEPNSCTQAKLCTHPKSMFTEGIKSYDENGYRYTLCLAIRQHLYLIKSIFN